MKLKQLAEHLGLSQTTVSRALNGYPEVAEATRRRVLEAAQRFDYRPNAVARRLATGRSGTVAILFPTERSLLVDPHFFEFLAGLAEKMAEADIELALKATPAKEELAAYRRLAEAERVDGFVISMPRLEDERVRLLAERGVPFVVHGRTRSQVPYAHLDVENEDAFRRAAELLLDLGHQRIALLNGDPRFAFARDREKGFHAAVAARGLSPAEAPVRSGPMTEEVGYRNAAALLGGEAPPTALLVSSVLSAFGAYRAARDLGLRIGQDVSVIAHDDDLAFLKPETLDPPLAVTASPIRAAGYRIGEMLIARIGGTPPQELQEVWPVDLIFRASVGPARRAGRAG